jgi:hypothetical protein
LFGVLRTVVIAPQSENIREKEINMKKNLILTVQKIATCHKFGVALFVVSALYLTSAHRSMGNCNTAIISHTPLSELNGTYAPDPNYPTICPSYSDMPCDPLSKYPCTGGLYLDKNTGNASNQQPSGHLSDGIGYGNSIAPINGKIVLLSMGMCNAWIKFGNDDNSFISKLCNSGKALFCAPGASRDKSLNTSLVVVNGAQSGKDALEWAKDPTDPASAAWNNLLKVPDGILDQAGVTPDQVQAIWCEHALIFDDPNCTNNCKTSLCTTFPQHAYTLRDAIEQTLRNIHVTFPNCKLVYISPRAYAYTLDFHNPEPKAYQTGFGDKWVILDQLNGLGNIGYKGANRTSPWIAWGPYLWTDGANARADGLTWLCGAPPNYSDVRSDFVHPSTNGVDKVAKQLIAFFKTDPTTTSWFLRANDPGTTISAAIPQLPETVHTSDSVTLTATATSNKGDIVSYLWTYDDGESANVQNPPSRKFNIPGTYNIHLTAIDRVGNHATTTGVLTVTP